MCNWWQADPNVNALRSGLLQHADNRWKRGKADNRIIHQHHDFPSNLIGHNTEFRLDLSVTQDLRGGDKGTADRMTPQKSHHVVTTPPAPGKTKGNEVGAIWDWHYDVGSRDWKQLLQLHAHTDTEISDLLIKHATTGKSIVGSFKPTLGSSSIGRYINSVRRQTGCGNNQNFTCFNVSDKLRFDPVEAECLRRNEVTVAILAQRKWTITTRVTHRNQAIMHENAQSVAAPYLCKGILQARYRVF